MIDLNSINKQVLDGPKKIVEHKELKTNPTDNGKATKKIQEILERKTISSSASADRVIDTKAYKKEEKSSSYSSSWSTTSSSKSSWASSYEKSSGYGSSSRDISRKDIDYVVDEIVEKMIESQSKNKVNVLEDAIKKQYLEDLEGSEIEELILKKREEMKYKMLGRKLQNKIISVGVQKIIDKVGESNSYEIKQAIEGKVGQLFRVREGSN